MITEQEQQDGRAGNCERCGKEIIVTTEEPIISSMLKEGIVLWPCVCGAKYAIELLDNGKLVHERFMHEQGAHPHMFY